MGLFHVGCRVLNPVTSKSTAVGRLMVYTDAEATWINATLLEAIGIERRKKDLAFQLANGQIITRSVGYAVLPSNSRKTECGAKLFGPIGGARRTLCAYGG